MTNFATNLALQRKAKCRPYQEAHELMASKPIDTVMQELVDTFYTMRKAVYNHCYGIARHNAPELLPTFEEAMRDIMPEGKLSDWRWNRDHRDRNLHKIVTTKPLWEFLKTCRKACKSDEQKQRHADAVSILADIERTVELLGVVYPVYAANTPMDEITHFAYDPKKPLSTQELPGYIWRRLAARNMMPTDFSYYDLKSVIPNRYYKLIRLKNKHLLKFTGRTFVSNAKAA